MTEPNPTGGGHPGLPRWVKVSAIIVALAVALAIAATLFLGVDHGPGRHAAGLAPAQVVPG